MYRYYIPALALILFFSGCGGAPVPYSEVKRFTASEATAGYTPGEVMTRFTGEELFWVRHRDVNVTESLAYVLTAPVEGLAEEIVLIPGEPMEVVGKGKQEGRETYRIAASRYLQKGIPHEVYVDIYPGGRVANRSVTVKNMKHNTTRTPLYFSYKTVNGVKFDKMVKKELTPLKGLDKKWSLSYSGSDGDTLKLFYKEYLDDFTRPLFTQELSYPRGAKTIRYKNLKLEIIRTDSEKIVFSVAGE
jgi:hypothetical protein